jgi:hypothetical protein
VYEYYLINEGWNRQEVNLNLLSQYSENHTNFTQFDPESIMVYEVPAFLTTNRKAIRGHHCKLSERDKSYIATLYPGVATIDGGPSTVRRTDLELPEAHNDECQV